MSQNTLMRFKDFLRKQCEVAPTDRVVVAVSGGRDSMCLLDLLLKIDQPCCVAHVDHKARKGASASDLEFVKAHCAKLNIDCLIAEIDVRQKAEESGMSFQEMARKVRYTFFEEVQIVLNCEFILTAHHRDDAIETFFVNLLRGTGLTGLTGIPLKNELVRRPLMCMSSDDIDIWVRQNDVSFREDISNQSPKYLRNRIRHELLPLLEDLRSGSKTRMWRNIERLASEHHFLSTQLDKMISPHSQPLQGDQDGAVRIGISEVHDFIAPALLLHAHISQYGFNFYQCQRIIELKPAVGRIFLTNSHRLLVDRDTFIITPLNSSEKANDEIEIGGVGEFHLRESMLHIQIYDGHTTVGVEQKTTQDPFEEIIDADTIKWPLKLRRWKKGDAFQPIGLNGTQKLQDFFTNAKLSRLDKERVWILADVNKIVWVVGMRLDDRFKVTEATENKLRLKWDT